MNSNKATISVNNLIDQIDRKAEVIPFNNLEKFIRLLEFVKGTTLEIEEKIIAEKMIT